VKPAATPPAANAGATSATPPLPAGSARVQLGAFKQVSDAEQTWQKLTKKFPDLLGGLSLNVVRVDLGEKGIYQRLQAGPLADRAAATALCEQLKTRKQDCLVVLH
jgi:cell division septation protein DedD